MGFFEILGGVKPKAARRDGTVVKRKKDAVPRGCEHCPRNKVKGIVKIKGDVHGRLVFVWAQSPGPDENRQEMELVGRSGQWFWKEMGLVGLDREDCDIQNVVRCWPADKDPETGDWMMRDPTKDEKRCCSIYTEEAMLASRAKVWIVLGRIAEEALFGKRAKNSDKVFYHGDTQVFVMDHPSYFLRGAPKGRLQQFRQLLKCAADASEGKTTDRFDYLRQQDYKAILTPEQAKKAGKELLGYIKKGVRIAWDVEVDVVDGQRLLLCVGASPKPGIARVFFLDHPANPVKGSARRKVAGIVRWLLVHQHSKVMHHGTSDVEEIWNLLNVQVSGYDYDTEYAEYLSDPSQYAYGLKSIVRRKLVRFSGYEDILLPEAVPEGMTLKEGKKEREFHLARVPIDRLTLYNGADCDCTKRVEVGTKDKVSQPLVRVYKDAAFILDEMEQFGPLLDPKQMVKIGRVYPQRKKQLVGQLQVLTKVPDFNPNSWEQVQRILYDSRESGGLGITPLDEKMSTDKETLELLRQKYKYPFITTLEEYRQVKNWNERIDAFQRSADAHEGRIRTIWWLTGTRTGRLSSGGGKRKDKRNLGNLQNIPGNDHVKNLLVSDLSWRELVWRWSSDKAKYLLRTITSEVLDTFRHIGVFVALDYSQMELRILAQVTGEQAMIKLFRQGVDIHAAVGSLWSGWSFKEIQENEKLRRIVKAFHFGIIYGLTAVGLHLDLLAKGVKISISRVEELHKQYFARFSKVKQYIKDMPAFAKLHGYVENLFGFRVPIDADGREAGAWWANQAVNAPIQGAAHQVLLCALALIYRFRDKYKVIRPQMEIHDSLLAVSRVEHLQKVARVATELLERDVVELTTKEFGIRWAVPLVAELKLGLRFGGLTKVKKVGDSYDLVSAFTAIGKTAQKQDTELRRLYLQYSEIAA